MSNGFDALGQFMRGAEYAEHLRQRPVKNLLADLEVQKARQGVQSQQQMMDIARAQEQRVQAGFDENIIVRNAGILNKAAKALKGIDPSQWGDAYPKVLSQLEAIGMQTDSLPSQTPTPQELDNFIVSTEAFISDPQKAMTEYQRQNLDLQRKRLEQQSTITPVQQKRFEIQEKRIQNASDVELQEELSRRKEEGKQRGKAAIESEISLPQTVATAEQSMSIIDKALSHPGLNAATGASSRLDPRNYTPGTGAYDFNVLMDQIQGRTFLAAFESLKGGGQITEIEGRKAEQAIARLNKAQSTEAFKEALSDLRDVIYKGLNKAKASAESLQSESTPVDQGVIMEDANGNRARVYKDGRIEEL